MTAHEARELATSPWTGSDEIYYRSLQEHIKESAQKGYFDIHVGGALPKNVHKKLTEEGYTLTEEDDDLGVRPQRQTKIAW